MIYKSVRVNPKMTLGLVDVGRRLEGSHITLLHTGEPSEMIKNNFHVFKALAFKEFSIVIKI